MKSVLLSEVALCFAECVARQPTGRELCLLFSKGNNCKMFIIIICALVAEWLKAHC